MSKDVSGHHTKQDAAAVRGIFGVTDVQRISRGAMIHCIARQLQAIQKLSLELYCADCTNELFAKNTAQQLVLHERERQRRERVRLQRVRAGGWKSKLKEWIAVKIGERQLDKKKGA